MRQLTLFGTEPRPLPREDSEPAQDREAPDRLAGSAEPSLVQIDLFAERARVARDLEGAVPRHNYVARVTAHRTPLVG